MKILSNFLSGNKKIDNNKLKAEYSETGTSIADVFIKNANENDKTAQSFYITAPPLNWEPSYMVLREGFNKILSNPETTQDEKALANLGINFGYGMDGQESKNVQYVVMKAILHKIQGPMGNVIAEVTHDAAKSIKTDQSSASERKVLRKGLEEIAGNSKATEEQQKLAQIGIETGDKNIEVDLNCLHEVSANVRYKIIDQIMNE